MSRFGWSMLANAGTNAGRMIADAFKGIITSSIQTNASVETATLQFKILMGDADRAKEHVKDLFEFAKATPFESGPIIEASRALRAAGRDALERDRFPVHGRGRRESVGDIVDGEGARQDGKALLCA